MAPLDNIDEPKGEYQEAIRGPAVLSGMSGSGANAGCYVPGRPSGPAPPPNPHQSHRKLAAAREEPAAPVMMSREDSNHDGDTTSPESVSNESERLDVVRPLEGHNLLAVLVPEKTHQRELSKWSEMLEMGIDRYTREYPDRFFRRVRRGIPQRYRWQVWKAKVGVQAGDPLMEQYRSLCGTPNNCTAQIEIDIPRTFPEFFTSQHQQALLRVLNAYSAHTPSVGYCQGMNFVAGLLLLVSGMREEESFAVLCRLMDSPEYGLAGFYKSGLPLLRRYLRACDGLLAQVVPDVRDHFVKENVQPAVYLYQWFLTLFINCFPLSMVIIIWDVIICEGLPVMLRIAVSILQVLKESLLNMKFEDIIKFFKKMKTYDDEEGTLNATKIGQLLMKHTEHVSIPQKTRDYLTSADDVEPMESDELWEVGGVEDIQDMGSDLHSSAWLSSSGWLHTIARWFSFGSSRRRSSGSLGTGSSRGSSNASVNDGSTAAGGGDAATRTTSPDSSVGRDSSVSEVPAPCLSRAGGSAAHAADSRLPPPSGLPHPAAAPGAACSGGGGGSDDEDDEADDAGVRAAQAAATVFPPRQWHFL